MRARHTGGVLHAALPLARGAVARCLRTAAAPLRPVLYLLCGARIGARGGKGGLYSYYGFELIYQYGTDISTLKTHGQAAAVYPVLN